MAWFYLLVAGVFEIGFTTSMKLADRGAGWANITFFACVIASFLFLSAAIKTIPLGIAYAVWTGIGAAGTLLVSTLFFREAMSVVQIGLVIALIMIVAALKLTSPS